MAGFGSYRPAGTLLKAPMRYPLSILLAALAMAGSPGVSEGAVENRLVRTLEERLLLITDRMRVGYAPFLQECKAHLSGGSLEPEPRARIEAITVTAFAAWIDKGDAASLPAQIQHASGLIPLISDGTLRRRIAADLGKSADPETVSDDDRSRLIEILRNMGGAEMERIARRFEGRAEPIASDPSEPAAPTAEELFVSEEWMAAYRTLAGMADPEAEWKRLRPRLVSRKSWGPIRIVMEETENHPALDAYCKRWDERALRIDPAARPAIRDGDSTAPFPARTWDGAWEVLLPLDGPYSVEVPVNGGDPLRLRISPSSDGEPIRIPDRVPLGMAFVPADAEGTAPFFIDRTECPASKVIEFLEGRPDDLEWLAEQVEAAMDTSRPALPALLRRDASPQEALRAAKNYAASWEGKSLPREEEWKRVTKEWAKEGMRRANLSLGASALKPVDSGDAAGPQQMVHLVGNAWEALEGGRIAGGGVERLPWRLARDPSRLLDSSFPWEEEHAIHVGFRMVIRLEGWREE